MYDYEKDEMKKIMLKELKDHYWDDINEQSSYEEIETAYNELQGELSASEDAMYPNGRDYDSESFD